MRGPHNGECRSRHHCGSRTVRLAGSTWSGSSKSSRASVRSRACWSRRWIRPVSRSPRSRTAERSVGIASARDFAQRRGSYDTNLVSLSADDLDRFARRGREFFARRYSIGVWFWETSVFEDRGSRGPVPRRALGRERLRSREHRLGGRYSGLCRTLPVELAQGAFPTRSELGLPERSHSCSSSTTGVGAEESAAVVEAFVEGVRAGGRPGPRPQEHPRTRLETRQFDRSWKLRLGVMTSSFGTATCPRTSGTPISQRATAMSRSIGAKAWASRWRRHRVRQAGDRNGILRKPRVHVEATVTSCPTPRGHPRVWWATHPARRGPSPTSTRRRL